MEKWVLHNMSPLNLKSCICLILHLPGIVSLSVCVASSIDFFFVVVYQQVWICSSSAGPASVSTFSDASQLRLGLDSFPAQTAHPWWCTVCVEIWGGRGALLLFFPEFRSCTLRKNLMKCQRGGLSSGMIYSQPWLGSSASHNDSSIYSELPQPQLPCFFLITLQMFSIASEYLRHLLQPHFL